ncbi:MAG: hypothetical protein IJ955_02495 [Oscillospiraceae bacterium]|nr:hypothetical protein [Oscillospiraceae bacterium]
MKKIEIINGVYGARDSKTRRVTPIPIGGTVDVADEEASRLVEMKVARVIGEESPVDGVATPPVPPSGDGAGENPPSGSNGAEGQENDHKYNDVLDIVDGHFVVEKLMTLERKDMEVLAADLEIPTEVIKKCKTKSELATLIAEFEVENEEEEVPVNTGETPPELGVENPVV